MFMQSYTTIAAPAQETFVEKRSRFIGYVAPICSEEEAASFISEKKSAHWDASHNVYAYILRDGTQRYSDDGEPQGTAGVPVLEVLRKEGLVDIVAVVTRYFGGVLLGAGGLVRAYSHSAKLGLDVAQRRYLCECTALSIECAYDFYGKLTHLLQTYRTVQLDVDFGVLVRMELLLRDCDRDAFEKALTELSAAAVTVRELDRRFAEIPE